MRVIILVSAVCMQFVWSHGSPANSKGVGAFAYQDSTGNRYGGTYDLEDGKVVNFKGTPPPDGIPDIVQGKLTPDDIATNFAPENFIPFQFGFPDFFPDHFRNLQSLFQENFVRGFDEDPGLRTAEIDSDITSGSDGDNPDISRFAGFGGIGGPGYGMNSRRFGMPGMGMPGMGMPGMGMPGMGMPGMGMPGMGMPGMGMPPMGMPGMDRQGMPMMGPNSAFAGAAAGPGYVQHQDFISPSNPNMPNVNVMKYSQPAQPGSGGFVSVSSKSYSSSSNINGQEFNNRGSETMVNNNGEVTQYSVHS